MCDCEDVQRMHYVVSKGLGEIKVHKARINVLLALVDSIAEGDCEYGDGCPDSTLNRRGRCRPCVARLTLDEYAAIGNGVVGRR